MFFLTAFVALAAVASAVDTNGCPDSYSRSFALIAEPANAVQPRALHPRAAEDEVAGDVPTQSFVSQIGDGQIQAPLETPAMPPMENHPPVATSPMEHPMVPPPEAEQPAVPPSDMEHPPYATGLTQSMPSEAATPVESDMIDTPMETMSTYAGDSSYVPMYTGSAAPPPSVANAAVGKLQPFFVIPNQIRRWSSRKSSEDLLRERLGSQSSYSMVDRAIAATNKVRRSASE